MSEAARLADEITHTGALAGLIAGAVVGAALLVAAVAVVGLSVLTFGLGGVLACVVGAAVIGGAVAGGASIGEQLGSLMEAVCGAIAPACSVNVFVNSRNSARTEMDFATCSGAPPVGPPHPPPAAILAQGSASVFINSQHAVRKGDLAACSAKVSSGSANVFIGGATFTTRPIDSEVPEWLENTIQWVGIASAFILLPLAPGLIIGGLVGSMIGAWGMSKLGGAIFGEGSKGQKAMGIIGGVLGGVVGGGLGARAQGAMSSRLGGTSADRVGKLSGGEPVDILTGEVFTDEIDFVLPWRIPLEWRRFYSSRRPSAGMLGYGWESVADARLEFLADGSVDFWDGKIAPVNFYVLPELDCDLTEPFEGSTLAVTKTGYTVRTRGGLTYRFAQTTAAHERTTPLVAIRDENENWVEFRRRHGVLAEIRSSCGPWLQLKSKHGLLQAVVLHHPRSHPRVLASYEHSPAGELVANLDPLGNPHRYYYEDRRLVRHSDRNGVTFQYEYEDGSPDSRCVRTWGENGLYDYRFTYQPELQRTLYTDSLGGEWIAEYDISGFLTSRAGPRGATTRYGYDEAGRLITFTDPLGRVTLYEYDDRANLLAITRPDTVKFTYRYDEQGREIERTDAAGHVWRLGWDEQGRLVSRVSPMGVSRAYEYDRRGDLVTYRNPNGAVTRFERDPYSNGVLAVTDPLGSRTQWTLDPLGRVTRRVDPAGAATDYDLDAKGRVTRTTRPSNVEVRFAYDRELNLTEYRDELGRVTRFTYTGINELAARHLPDGSTVRYEYDTEERLVAVINGRGERYGLDRDTRGRVIRRVDYWGAVTELTRNAAGEIVERLDALGRRTIYENDLLGRLRARVYADGSEERFVYDEGGNLVEMTNADTRVARDFDADGRLLRETQNDFQVAYAYDAVGNCVRRSGSAGNVIEYGYDAANRLRSLQVNGDAVLSLDRDERGLAVRERLGAQMTRTREFDVEGRIVTQRLAGPAGGIVRREYQYDPVGRLRRRREGTDAPETFGYDPVGRLIHHQDPEGTIHQFLRDAAGDFLEPDPWENDDPVIPGSAPEPAAADEPPAVAQRDLQFGEKRYRFDAAGNIIEIRSIHDRTRLYWSGENRLSKARTPTGLVAHYRYDASGRRLGKEFQGKTTSFGWSGATLMAQKAGDQWTEFVYAERSFVPLLMIVDSKVFYYQNDVNGAPCEVVDGAGEIAWQGRYGTWGNAVETGSATLQNPLRLQGQYHDAETNLHYNLNRYYDGDSGTFLTTDPIGLAGGDNLYQIAPDTWNWIDPLGLSCTPTPGNEPGRSGAFNAAKRDAGIPRSQQPDIQPNGKQYAEVPMTQRGGGAILDDQGQPVMTREYTYTRDDGSQVVIQDHSAGHDFGEGGVGDQGPHFNVRPIDNTRTGSVPGTQGHYPFNP